MHNCEGEEQTQTIAVLLFEQFSNHCLANAIEPFRAANTIGGVDHYAWQFLSLSGGTVRSSSGLPVETGAWEEIRPSGDYLFVMPSYGFRDYRTPKTVQVLRAARKRFKVLAGLDTGAWLLAAAGLLDGRRATIHWDEYTAFAEAFPETDGCEDRFVLEADLATCGGASTAMELALDIIKQRHGTMFALELAALFMHGDKLDLHDPYQRRTTDVLIGSATAIMRRTVEAPLTIQSLASRLGVDQRRLEAAFAAELQVTPRSAYKTIRLREARRLVAMTNLTVAEIATRCGYQNASAMTRAYRAEFGVTPQQHRRSE